jgi:hypothetical protein
VRTKMTKCSEIRISTSEGETKRVYNQKVRRCLI